MVTSFSRATVALWLSVVVAAGFAACGGNSDVASPGDKFPNKDASVEGSAGDSGIINEGGGIDVGVNDAPQTFDVQPSALIGRPLPRCAVFVVRPHGSSGAGAGASGRALQLQPAGVVGQPGGHQQERVQQQQGLVPDRRHDRVVCHRCRGRPIRVLKKDTPNMSHSGFCNTVNTGGSYLTTVLYCA